MPSVVKMIACHFANRSGRGQAAIFLPENVVDEMFEARLVVWNKKHTYVNFTKTEAALTPTQRSIRMGPPVMLGYAMGEARDIALVDAWQGRKAA